MGAILPDFRRCLLRQFNHFIVDQTRLAEPCSHQNDRSFAGFGELQQRIRITNLDIIRRKPLSFNACSARRQSLLPSVLSPEAVQP
jgi:hypothetical protein